MLELDAVVVGAGQAGLGMSYFLQRDGRSHVVFEKGRIGETWLSQRWDSFRLNSSNSVSVLPGYPYDGPEPDGFWSHHEFVHYLQEYAEHWRLPVRTGVTVESVEQVPGRGRFLVRTRSDGQAGESLTTRSVVVASGIQRTPRIPALASRLPQGITQLHSAEYRNPGALPPGGVLVVGSAQSGCQIAEDLLSAGRTVYLGTSRVGRVPRRYRGRDILQWWIDTGFADVTFASLEDKAMANTPLPQLSGIGRYGHTVSLQYLAGLGAVILGRLLDVDDGTLVTGDDAAANVLFADQFSQRNKDNADAYLARMGMAYPPLEDDPADRPDPKASCVSPLRRLNLADTKVGTVIWATGFGGDFSWLRLPVLDAQGRPLHQEGVSPVRGLYFVGLPWLRSRKSGIIYGIQHDAQYIAAQMEKQLG